MRAQAKDLQAEIAKPITLTVNRAAAVTGLGISTVWKLISEGKLETVSIGRRRLVRYTSIERLLAGKVASEAG